jgi:soluble lytic murein transglycosylase-like protein
MHAFPRCLFAVCLALAAPAPSWAAAPAVSATPPVRKAAAKPVVHPWKAAFQKERAMNPAQLVQRWKPIVTKASRRFGVSVSWINAVMRVESGGRTMLSENTRMVSDKGAIGIMQVMPGTYAEMRAQYRLGADPFDPADNIHAGAAYLRWLKGKYAYPAMFAAYNAGPERIDGLLTSGTPLPEETRNYVTRIGVILEGGGDGAAIRAATFTRPDGTPVLIDPAAVQSIRATLPGEYAPGVQTVLRLGGRLTQGVREDVAAATAAIRIRGGRI